MPRFNRRHQKNQRGSILILFFFSTAMIVLLAVFLFNIIMCLFYKQRIQNAAEAAALFAASDLGEIVVDDPSVGFVSLSEPVPVGKAILANDGYCLPIRSYNELLGTIRLDMSVADSIGSQTMLGFAREDLRQLMEARKSLKAALVASLQPQGSIARDKNGAIVKTYMHARTSLTENIGSLTANAKTKLNLSLGEIDGLPTETLVCATLRDSLRTSENSSQHYLSYVDAPCCDEHYFFAAVAREARLIDGKTFHPANAKNCTLPSVVRVEVEVADLPLIGQKVTLTANAFAIPSAGCNPTAFKPGTLVLTFPDGKLSSAGKILDLLARPEFQGNQMGLYTAWQGDYPAQAVTLVSASERLSNSSAAACANRSLYDWLRRLGSAPRLATITAMLSAELNAGLKFGEGGRNVFEMQKDGTIKQTVTRLSPNNISYKVSNKQLYAITKQPIIDNTGVRFDMLCFDQVNQVGNMNGGIHGGQPLTNSSQQAANESVVFEKIFSRDAPESSIGITCEDYEKPLRITMLGRWSGDNQWIVYSLFKLVPLFGASAEGALDTDSELQSTERGIDEARPTYLHNGQAVELCCRTVFSSN